MSDNAAAPCEHCPIQPPRAVASRGPVPARLLLLSGAPRYHEEHEGTAFASPTFTDLEAMLTAAGLDAGSVHYATLTGCRPPHQRPIRTEEIAACGPRLDQTVAAVAPDVVVLCGPDAVAAMLPGVTLETGHGHLVVRGRRRYYPIRHPYAALHYQHYVDEVASDLRHLADLLAAGRLGSEAVLAEPEAVERRVPIVPDEDAAAVPDEDTLPAAAISAEIEAVMVPLEEFEQAAAEDAAFEPAPESMGIDTSLLDDELTDVSDETSTTITAASEQEPADTPVTAAAIETPVPHGDEDEAPAQLSLF